MGTLFSPLIYVNLLNHPCLPLYGKKELLRCFLLLSVGFRRSIGVGRSKQYQKEETLDNGGGFHRMLTVLRPSSLSRAILGRGDQKWAEE